MSRLVQITVTTPTGTLWAQRYGFNLAGERIYTLAGTTGTIGDAYNLDATGQLIGVKYGATGVDSGYASATNPTSTATWSYDEADNRITQVDGAGTTTNSSNAVNQYTAVTGAGTLAYSSRGDLTQQGDWSYVHDAGGNLIRAHNTQSNLLAKYWRDAAGHRAVKEVNSAKTLYFNFGFWPLEAYDTTAETGRSTVYEPGIDRPLCEINNDGSIRFFYHQDWLGNVAMLTDAAGAKLQTYSYDVWGEPSGFDVSGNPIASTAFESRFLFTAREYDPETSLYHYRARAYSPAMGRFLQTDPIDFAGGDANLMRYASNSPVNLVDPFGLVEMSYTPNSHQGLRDWEETYDNPEAFDVTGHGNKDTMYDCEGREMAPDEVADDIVNHPSFRPGMPVNLISCNTGQGGKGSFADKLAKAIKNKTGVPSKVTAPEKKIGPKLDRNKNPIPGSKPQQPGLDKWRRFK